MYEELIQALQLHCEAGKKIGLNGKIWTLLGDGSSALEALTAQLAALQAENAHQNNSNEVLRAERDELYSNNCKLRAALSRVEAERDAGRPSAEVLEAIDELVEFARDRMSIGMWLGYVNVLNEWRSAQEDG